MRWGNGGRRRGGGGMQLGADEDDQRPASCCCVSPAVVIVLLSGLTFVFGVAVMFVGIYVNNTVQSWDLETKLASGYCASLASNRLPTHTHPPHLPILTLPVRPPPRHGG